MQTRKLGKSGPEVSAIGLGCMAMSGLYGPADRGEAIATIHAALDAGIDLIDTGDFYGMGHNEMLIGEALKGVPRDNYKLSVKFGALRDHGSGWNGYDARPIAVKNFLAYTLQRLGVDYIDIYRPARLDPNVPIEDTVGAIAECIEAGWVRHVGLSEVGPETLRRVLARYPRLSVIVAHLGAPEYGEFLELAQTHERVRLDTTMVFTEFFSQMSTYPPALLPRLADIGDREAA